MAIYETSNEAGQKVRSRGQAISTGGYTPGDFYRAAEGRDYVIGREAAEAVRQRKAGIASPVSAAPSAAPSDVPVAAPAGSLDDYLKEVDKRLDAKFAAEASQTPSAPPSQGSLGGDAVRALGTGTVNLVGGGYEIGNLLTGGYADDATKAVFGKSGSEALADVRGSIRQGESAELKAQRAELEKADGFVDSFMTVVSNPRLAGMMTLEMVPQLLTVAGAARTVAAKTMAAVATSEMAAGASLEAAQIAARAAATTNATRTVLGLNAVMEGGSAASDARQQVMTMSEAELSQSPQYNELVAQFGDTPEGRKNARTRLANEASAFSAAIAGSVSLLSGAVTGAGKLESQVLTRGILREGGEQAAERTALGVAKNIAVAGAKEIPQEAIEEGGSTFGTNVGLKYSGAKPEQSLMEGVPEAAGTGGALGLVSGGGFGAMSQTRTALKGPEKADAPAAETDQPSTKPSDTVRSFMSEKDFQSAINSPEFMAASYARADEATRGRLQDANPNLDLAALSKDQAMVAAGDQIIDGNESFVRAFGNSLRTGQIQPVTTSDQDTTPNAPADQVPPLERMRMDQEMYDREMGIQEQNREERKSTREVDSGSLNAGPANVAIPGLPNQDVLLRGYESRSENLMRLPEGYRREQAERSVAEMVGRGFTPEQAQSVFAAPLGQAQVEEIDAAPPPAETDLDFTKDQETPIPQTMFGEIAQRLATNDARTREPDAKPSDYSQADLPAEIQEIAKMFGVEVFGFRYSGKNETLKKRLGTSMGGGVVVLNADAKNNHLSILGHEVYHELAKRNPKAAEQLTKAIVSYITERGQEQFRADLLRVGYDVSTFDEEMAADVMGIMFGEKKFWRELSQKEPSLLQKIIQVLDDMLVKFGDLTSRSQKIERYVTDLDAVRSMLVDFVNETNNATDLDFTQMSEMIDSFDFDSLSKEEQGAVNNVRQLLSEGKTTEAAAAFRATNLYKSKGVSFNDLQKEKPQDLSTERDVVKTAKQISEQDKNATRTIVDHLINKRPKMASELFRSSGIGERTGLTMADMQKRADEFKASPKKAPSIITKEDEQGSLPLKRDITKYDTEVSKILSGMNSRLEYRTESREEAIQSRQRKDAAARANKEEGQTSMLEDDAGGVFNAFARSGSYGTEGYAEFDERQKSSEERAIDKKRSNEERAAIMRGRIKQLMKSSDKGLAQLQSIRERMKADGFSESEIDATVGKAEKDLKALRDGELATLTQEGFEEIAPALDEDQKIRERNEPEQFNGSNEIQAELDLNDQQRTDARRLVDAVLNKQRTRERMEKEGASEKDIKEAVDKASDMTLGEAVATARKSEIGLMHLYDAMREAGMTIKKEMIDISGNVAANNTLESYVKKYPNNPLSAREGWLKSYDNLPIKSIVPLTKGEEAAYKSWKKNREKVMNRLKTDPSAQSATLEEAFPNALFLNYTLNEMRDTNKLDEPTRAMMVDLFPDPVRAWFKDISNALAARPDLKEQLGNYLTKAEMEAYKEFAGREAREAQRILDMKMRSPAYSQLAALTLPAELYMKFRNEIAKAQETELAVILNEASELSDRARAAIEAGQDIGETLDGYLNVVMQQDEARSESPDQILDEEVYDEDGAPQELRFRRGTHSGVVPALALEEHFNTIFSKWDVKPNYTVVESPTQLPTDVSARLTSRFTQNNFKGAIDPKTGHVYVFSSFAESNEDAEFTMFHELYGHWGMRAFLGDKLDSFLNNQYRLNQKVKAEADRQLEQSKKDGMPMNKLESIEEAISDLAVNGDPSIFRQLVGRLVSWLRKHGMNTVADWMDSSGESELAAVLGQARKVAMSKQGISPLAGAPTDVLYNRGKPAPAEAYAIRDGKVTGYARVNPITTQWTVFTINDGEKSLENGNYGIQQVDKLSDAHNILKKLGQVTVARNRDTIKEVDPRNVNQIPDFADVGAWGRFKRYLILKAQNMYLPIFEVARYLEGKGVKNSVIDDLIKYESRLQFHIQNYERNFAVPITKLLKSVGEKGLTLEDVDLFLMARHAKERNDVIKAVNPKNTRGSGLSTKDANRILSGNNDGKWADARAELNQIGQLTDKMSKAKLNYMLSTGLINKFQYRSLSGYSHYVNLSGNKELGLDEFDGSQMGGRAFNVRGSDIIRSTGRGTQAVDVLQNTMNSYLSVLIRGQKNVPLRAMLDMFEKNPDKTYVEVNPIKTQKKIDVEKLNFDNKILRAIGDMPSQDDLQEKIKRGEISAEQFNSETDNRKLKSGKNYMIGLKERIARKEISVDEAMAELADRVFLARDTQAIDPEDAARVIRRINEQMVEEARLSPDGYVSTVEVANPSKNEVVVKVDGKPVMMTFNGRSMDFFQAITGMNIQESGDLVDALGAWSRFFSQMVTTWNPAWIPVNAMRDIQAAIANAAADPEVGAVLAGKMMKEWKRSGHTAFKYMVADYANANDGFWGKYFKDKAVNSQIDPAEKKLLDEFFEDGAGTFFLDRNGLEQTIDKLNRHLNPMTAGKVKNLSDAQVWTADKLSAVGDLMELISMPIEIAPRFAMYKTLRDAGWDRSRAARYAKELTVNFNMKGASKWFRSVYIFANPAVQGTVRLFKDYSRGKEGIAKYMPSNRFAAVASVWMGLGWAASLIARTIGGADDDDDKPGMDKLDMVPDYRRATSLVLLPDVYGGSIPVAYGWNVFSTAGGYAADVMLGKMKVGTAAQRTLTAAFDAFAPIGSGAESESFAGTLAKTVAPSATVPVIEILMNENRFGAPLYRDPSLTDVKQSDAYMHFNNVNPISKSLMHSLAELTSGGKNPRYHSAMVDVNPATVDHMINSYLPGIISEAYKFAGTTVNIISGKDTKPMDLPLVGRFRAKIDEDSFDSGAFRRVSEQVSTLYKEYMSPDTTDARRAEIRKDYQNIGGVKALMSGTDQQIKKMNQNLRSFELDPKNSDSEKIAARNRIEKDEKKLRNRAITEALKRGFRDAVVNDSPEE